MMRDFKPYVPSAREAALRRFEREQRASLITRIGIAAVLVTFIVATPFAIIERIEWQVVADMHDELCDDTDNMTDTCVEWRAERGAP